jgi:hypothetical protein
MSAILEVLRSTRSVIRECWTTLFRIHIDLPSWVVFLGLVVFFRRQLLDELLLPAATVLSKKTSGTIGEAIAVNVGSSILAAVLLGGLGLLAIHHLKRVHLTGKFTATVAQNGAQVPWGNAKILCSPVAPDRNGVPVWLSLKHDDIDLRGQGLLIDNRVLVGHYSEVGRPERRRCGVFLYELDGNGQTWSGTFLYLDPNTSVPSQGSARWTRQ